MTTHSDVYDRVCIDALAGLLHDVGKFSRRQAGMEVQYA